MSRFLLEQKPWRRLGSGIGGGEGSEEASEEESEKENESLRWQRMPVSEEE